MPKRVFFSFHYQPDSWRVSQVRSMGAIEGDQIVTDNDWETIANQGVNAIENWINSQMANKKCVVVLIGADTAGRKWIEYEIKQGWNTNKGVLGINIHNLKNQQGLKSQKGSSPFRTFTINSTGMDNVVRTYDPPFTESTDVYNYIKNNLEQWIDEAITIRSKY